MAGQERQYTGADLYGANGRPHAADIDQDGIYNCYFLAPMGALGEKHPDRIRDAIRFNDETGDFTVSLYRPPNAQERAQGQTNPIQESITVSQEDIRHNIRREGGGTVDNNRERNGPLWPTVIEAGFAELYGRNPKGEVNFGQGYRTIGALTGGGALSDGTYALTGESGRSLQIHNPDAPPMQPTGPNHVARAEPPPFRAPSHSAKLGLDAVYAEVEQALTAGRPVSMSTQGRDVGDGLEESHAYMVVGVSRNPQNNEALVTLRNPYGNNQRAGEGNQNIGAGWKDANPEITVSLNRLVRDGSFGEFNIGPAARVQTQQQDTAPPATPAQPPAAAPATPGEAPTQTAPNPPVSTSPDTQDITHSTHPGYLRFQQALNGIADSPNIPPETFTGERLKQTAANVAYTSLAGKERPGISGRNEALSHIDCVVFNKNCSALIAVQGELIDPAAKRAFLPGTQDNETTLAQASQRTSELLQDPQKLALANPAAAPQLANNHIEPDYAGPRR
jgi:Calpain family cysteine protease